MPNTPDSSIPSLPGVRNHLEDAARLLRESTSIDPDVHRLLTDLVDEVGQTMDVPAASPAEMARLAECTAHLVEALHHGHDRSLLERARDRLRELILQAETRSPTAVHLVERLTDALANIGI